MCNFSIYDKLDSLDISKLATAAKSATWPKGKRYTVNCNGIEFKIQTYLAKAAEDMPTRAKPEYTPPRGQLRKTIIIENSGRFLFPSIFLIYFL